VLGSGRHLLVIAVLQFAGTFLWGSSALDGLFADPTITDEQATQQLAGLYGATVIPAIVSAVLQVVATGMLTVVMGQSVLGRRVTTAQAWERTKPRIWALFGVTLLVGLIVGATFIGGIALAVLIGVGLAARRRRARAPRRFGLGAVAILAGIWLGSAAARAVRPRARAHWPSVDASLGPPREGAWWRTFGIYLLATILAQIISTVFSFPLGILAGLLPSWWARLVRAGAAASTGLAVLLTSIITLPFLAGVTSLLYIDRHPSRGARSRAAARGHGAWPGASLVAAVVAGTRLPLDVPVVISREEAQQLARLELAKPDYTRQQESLVDRILSWIGERVNDALNAAGEVSPQGWVGLVVLALVVASRWSRSVGVPVRSRATQHPLFEGRQRRDRPPQSPKARRAGPSPRRCASGCARWCATCRSAASSRRPAALPTRSPRRWRALPRSPATCAQAPACSTTSGTADAQLIARRTTGSSRSTARCATPVRARRRERRRPRWRCRDEHRHGPRHDWP
jgi:hypothetical protein